MLFEIAFELQDAGPSETDLAVHVRKEPRGAFRGVWSSRAGSSQLDRTGSQTKTRALFTGRSKVPGRLTQGPEWLTIRPVGSSWVRRSRYPRRGRGRMSSDR